MVSKQKMELARQLIQRKDYDRARQVLVTLDHPTADKWLERLNMIDPVQPRRKPSKLWKYLIRAVIVVMVLVTGFMAWWFFMGKPGLDNVILDVALSSYCREDSILSEAECDVWAENIRNDPAAKPIIEMCEDRAGDAVLFGIGSCLWANGVFPPG